MSSLLGIYVFGMVLTGVLGLWIWSESDPYYDLETRRASARMVLGCWAWPVLLARFIIKTVKRLMMDAL